MIGVGSIGHEAFDLRLAGVCERSPHIATPYMFEPAVLQPRHRRKESPRRTSTRVGLRQERTKVGAFIEPRFQARTVFRKDVVDNSLLAFDDEPASADTEFKLQMRHALRG